MASHRIDSGGINRNSGEIVIISALQSEHEPARSGQVPELVPFRRVLSVEPTNDLEMSLFLNHLLLTNGGS